MAIGSTSEIVHLAADVVKGAPVHPKLPPYGASLYVGDLDASVGEELLYETFTQVAPVISVRVCRDMINQTSLGYGYVNFSTQQDALSAMETLNCTPINGKSVRVMFSNRDPSVRRNYRGNLYIKNLDPKIDTKAILETFSTFGPVLSCKICTDSNGKSLGFGFVHFEDETSAEKAIARINGMLVNDKKVYVGPFVRRQVRERPIKKDGFTNVFVKNLPDSFTEEDLRNEFGICGEITSAVVMSDELLGNSKCFGFVNFENAEAASEAIEKMNGIVLEEKVVYVGKAQKKAEREKELKEKFEKEKLERREKSQGMNVYIKNLDEGITDEDLKDMFSKFGEITSCKLMVDALGTKRGSAFVAFTTSEAAQKAINGMKGIIIGTKPLYVALAERKEDRIAKIIAHFAQLNVGTMRPEPVYYTQGAGALPVPSFGYQPAFRPPTSGVSSSLMTAHHRIGVPLSIRGPPHHHQGHDLLVQNCGNGIVGRTVMPVQRGGAGTGGNAGMNFIHSALTTALSSASLENQHLILGEQLYLLVEKYERENTGKVTGMLLEMDQTEVLHLIESPHALKKKVKEAVQVLQLTNAN